MIERELETALKKHRPSGKPFMLAEVSCSSQSPLCHQVQKLGELAFRGLGQGDLSQPALPSIDPVIYGTALCVDLCLHGRIPMQLDPNCHSKSFGTRDQI